MQGLSWRCGIELRVSLPHACHYVDLAGLSFVKEGMLAHGREIADRGLSFVVSAGWQPGITEFLPVYAHAQARIRMETIESLSVYFGDSGDWSAAAFQDIAWYLRRNGLGNPGFFRKGERVRARMLQASARVDLRGRVGCRRFSLFSMSEPDEIGRRLNDCDVFIYAQMPGVSATMAAALVALVPLPRSWALPSFATHFGEVPCRSADLSWFGFLGNLKADSKP